MYSLDDYVVLLQSRVFFLHCSGELRDLHSFPTRRSSDLGPGMLAALCVAFLVNMTAFPLTNGLLPFIAREIFHTDQAGLGYLSASFASGSLIGSIALSLTSGVRIARLLIGATLAWYALLL